MKHLLYIVIILCFLSCSDNKVEKFYENGKLMEEYSIDKDKEKHGIFRSYYPTGILKEDSNYKKGNLTGKRILFYATGQKEIEESYSEMGHLEGQYYNFYPNGDVKLEKNYKKNILSGILKAYYSGGKLKEQVTMSNNEENGPFSEYFENGQIQWKGTYRNGDNEYGILYEYDSLGTPIKIMKCDTQAICRTIWKPGMPIINVDTVKYE